VYFSSPSFFVAAINKYSLFLIFLSDGFKSIIVLSKKSELESLSNLVKQVYPSRVYCLSKLVIVSVISISVKGE
jgi:hypothetical protein